MRLSSESQSLGSTISYDSDLSLSKSAGLLTFLLEMLLVFIGFLAEDILLVFEDWRLLDLRCRILAEGWRILAAGCRVFVFMERTERMSAPGRDGSLMNFC